MLLNKQKGYAEIILITIMLTVTALVTSQFYSLLATQDIRERAIEAGRHLQEYNYGVMRYLSEQGLNAVPDTYSGVGWLKTVSCGGTSSSAYIATCGFSEYNTFGDSYTTEVTINGNIVKAVTTLRYPQYMGARDIGGVKDGDSYLAAVIRSAASNYLSDSTPVAQTFAEYELDKNNKDIVVTVSTSPNDDMWLRTDGSNKMNADTNFNDNDLYGVSSIYGASTAVVDRSTTVTVGSMLNVDGTLTVGDDSAGAESYLEVLGMNAMNHSILAKGGLQAAFVDSLGDLTIGNDGVVDAAIEFTNDSDSRRNIQILGKNGDLAVKNADLDATLVSDYVYDTHVNRYIDQAVYNITLADHGDIIARPPCAPNRTPQIFLSAASLSGGILGAPVVAFDTYATSVSGGGWMVNLEYKTSDENTIHKGDGRVLAVVKCS